MKKLEIQFGGNPESDVRKSTPAEEIISFSLMFADFLSNAGIDSSAHQLMGFEDRFVAILTVSVEDAAKIETWYKNLRRLGEE